MDLTEKIKAILTEVLPGADLNSETLADDGIVDSLAVLSIVSELAIEFDIEIPFDALSSENFNSVSAIAKLVESLKDA